MGKYVVILAAVAGAVALWLLYFRKPKNVAVELPRPPNLMGGAVPVGAFDEGVAAADDWMRNVIGPLARARAADLTAVTPQPAQPGAAGPFGIALPQIKLF